MVLREVLYTKILVKSVVGLYYCRGLSILKKFIFILMAISDEGWWNQINLNKIFIVSLLLIIV
jgi:hypothetical protein